jgi:hypothetical protein
VTTEIKYLVFKGIEKKEQILFKSFLNLAKNELEYQVVILKENSDFEGSPDIVIADSSYDFSTETALGSLPTIRVGNELDKARGYIVRPVQWSDFKTELTRLNLEAGGQPDGSVESGLPQVMEFVLAKMDKRSKTDPLKLGGSAEADAFDYELDNLSIDYHSFTNSEYVEIDDDVKGFKDGDKGIDLSKAVVMIADDESGSVNSVLIIETNSLDVWEMSEAEIEDRVEENSESIESESSDVDAEAEALISIALASGSVVKPGHEFWLEDAEIYSAREQLLVVRPARELVYSHREPGKWTEALRRKTITKCSLAAKWRPSEEIKAFPLSRLIWANTIANKSHTLASDLDPKTEYILERWPHFDLLELDNMLLKLCTMLFVQAESPNSLLQKSGYSRSVVYGLVNACHDLNILRVAAQFDLEEFSRSNANDGMFGKIKDVFR